MSDEKEAVEEVIGKLTMNAAYDEQKVMLQRMAYRAGYFAAISDMIAKLMSMQSEHYKTPYDK